jgi:hypothetical protein
MKRRFSIVLQRNVMVAVCALLSAIVGSPGYAQNSSSTKSGEAMQTFVLIFHQGSPAPTAEERQRVTGDVVAWADKLNAEGHKLDPRILRQEGAIRGENGSARLPSGARPITALLFLEARDLEEAIRIAESHPALRNRAVVEVRQWDPPVRPVQR